MLSFRALLLCLGLALGAVACQSPSIGEPSRPDLIPRFDSTLSLHRYDGSALPLDMGPIPPAPHTGASNPACRFELRDGQLEARVSFNWFHLTYNIYNTCGNHRISGVDVWGRVTQGRDTLYLEAGAGAFTHRYTAILSTNRVTLSFSGHVLEFR